MSLTYSIGLTYSIVDDILVFNYKGNPIAINDEFNEFEGFDNDSNKFRIARKKKDIVVLYSEINDIGIFKEVFYKTKSLSKSFNGVVLDFGDKKVNNIKTKPMDKPKQDIDFTRLEKQYPSLQGFNINTLNDFKTINIPSPDVSTPPTPMKAVNITFKDGVMKTDEGNVIIQLKRMKVKLELPEHIVNTLKQ